MLGGSVFFYLVMMGHIRHMKHEQLLLKQTNVWNGFVLDSLGTAVKLAGEYTIAPDVARQDVEADSANLAYLMQTHFLNGRPYVVTTYISAKEYQHLLIKIGIAEAIIFIVLLIAIIVVNRRTSVGLWTPFYSTMTAIRGYDIRQNRSLLVDTGTGIEEFNQLNKTLTDLIDRIDRAYRNQKQFTENASHELQTPLAIIRSKVELLSESPDLNEDNAGLLQEIAEANERLSQMNKNLLLLTKIENGMFPESCPIDLSEVVLRLSRYYENEVFDTSVSIQPGISITANPSLIEILVNNLLRNAYMHNVAGGWVRVQLTEAALIISNSGAAVEGDPERLFDRFRKGRVDNRSTGLGLALVRQIVQLYGNDITYTYQAEVHRLSVSFK